MSCASHKIDDMSPRMVGAIVLYGCTNCGLIFNKSKWGVQAAGSYNQYYKADGSRRFGLGVEWIVRCFRFLRALKIFLLNPTGKTILDIGSGRGFTLYYLKKYFRYERTAGTQIAQNAFWFAKKKLDLEMYSKDLLELNLDEGSFDLVTMWHVLEHVPEPEAYVERVFALLRPGGKFLVEVPNFNAWSRFISKEYWLGLDLDHHMTFFDVGSLKRLLKENGFKIRKFRSFSLEYSTFTSAQSLLSRFSGTDHFFFHGLQNFKLSPRLFFHGLVFLLLSPICLVVNMLLLLSTHGEVLSFVAEKESMTLNQELV